MTTSLVSLLDFAGTFAFAISGALVAVRHRLDLFGVLVLAFAAAAAGGILRDIALGATPPVALVDWRYAAVSIAAGLLTFFRHAQVERMRNPVQLFDAVGLGLFAVLGTSKALQAGLGPLGAIMLGILTGVGGGVVRDVLVAQIPGVLKRELYAVAALARCSGGGCWRSRGPSASPGGDCRCRAVFHPALVGHSPRLALAGCTRQGFIELTVHINAWWRRAMGVRPCAPLKTEPST
jgi:uncharacterized membrane protein YeiH